MKMVSKLTEINVVGTQEKFKSPLFALNTNIGMEASETANSMEAIMVESVVVKLLAIAAAFLGFLPLSNPFGKFQKFKFRLISLFTFISLFQLVWPILYLLDVLVALSSTSGQLTLT